MSVSPCMQLNEVIHVSYLCDIAPDITALVQVDQVYCWLISEVSDPNEGICVY